MKLDVGWTTRKSYFLRNAAVCDKGLWCDNDYFGDYLVVGDTKETLYIFDCDGNMFWKGHANTFTRDPKKGTISLSIKVNDDFIPIKETEVPYNW